MEAGSSSPPRESDPRILAAVADASVPPELVASSAPSGRARGTSVPRAHRDAPTRDEGPTLGLERLGEVKRFTLYEARAHFYLVAHSTNQTRFRVLKVDRVPPLFAQHDPEAQDPPSTAATPAGSPVQSQHGSHELRRGHARDASLSHAVQSIVEDQPESAPRPPGGTLSSGITELASSLATSDAPPRDAAQAVRAPLVSSSGLRYLNTDDDAIPHLRQTPEWKGYTSNAHDDADAPPAPTPGASGDAQERTLPPIAALGAPRSPKQPATRAPPPVPDAAEAPAETPRADVPPTPDPAEDAAWQLSVTSDDVAYTADELNELLDTIREGNRSTGGLKEVGHFFGLIGFVRFTSTYYMVLISHRSAVALIGGHYVYHCDETRLVPVCHASLLATLPGRSKAREQFEAQCVRTFRQVDLSKNFYFSYTYDVTRTLQEVMTGPRRSSVACSAPAWGLNEKWMWNFHLLLPAFGACRDVDATPVAPLRAWVLPLVHGFVDQAKLLVLGRTIYVTLLARRSRHFAGARFHKRGTDDEGYVANDVETEQIVHEPTTSPVYAPSADGAAHPHTPSPHFTSYVMLRGSIPVFWTQDSTNMSPRPPITISVADPYFVPAMRHFDRLFRAYGTPVVVLNLIKAKERQPRESKLLHAYGECIEYLNQFLPDGSDGGIDRRIRYVAWDMSRASKSRDQDVIRTLESLAHDTLRATRFFHSGRAPRRARAPAHTPILLQHGVARINCVDCLDRTNAAQFVLGKTALAHQLQALGLLDHARLSFDSDAINMLTEMYHDLGDTIALQYGGSALAHTTDTYRKINHWSSHSRDMIEGLKRYYANSFADADKQAAIDLFLHQPRDGDAPHAVSTSTPLPAPALAHVDDYLVPDEDLGEKLAYLDAFVNADRHFWARYYRPGLFTDLQRHHAYKMTAVHQRPTVLPGEALPALNAPPSPTDDTPSAPLPRASVRPLTAMRRASSALTQRPDRRDATRLPRGLLGGVRRWMAADRAARAHARPRSPYDAAPHAEPSAPRAAPDAAEPSALELAVAKSLAPAIAKQEQREYAAYTTQFAHLPFQRTPRTADADMQVYENVDALPAAAMHVDPHPVQYDTALAAYVRTPALELAAPARPRTSPPRARVVSAPATSTPVRTGASACATPDAALDARARTYAAWLHLAHVR